MRYTKYLLSTVVLTLFLVGMIAPTSAEVTWTETEGKVTAETDNLYIEVTGESNVPAYTFRGQTETNNTRHRAQFVELFEFEDSNDNGKYDGDDNRVEATVVALASLDVGLSSVVETGNTNTEASFNMSLTAQAAVSLQFSEIIFQNHISSDNETKLKFDVIIDSYTFTSSSNMLAIAFQMTSTSSNQTTMIENNDTSTMRFGQNAYVESQNKAMVGNQEVNVSMSVNQSAGGAIHTYFAYPSFNGQLVHDPAFGVDQHDDSSNHDDDDDGDDGMNDTDNSLLAFPVELLATGLILVPVARKIKY